MRALQKIFKRCIQQRTDFSQSSHINLRSFPRRVRSSYAFILSPSNDQDFLVPSRDSACFIFRFNFYSLGKNFMERNQFSRTPKSPFRIILVSKFYHFLKHIICLLEQEFAHEQYNRQCAVCLCNQHYPLWIVAGQVYNIFCYRGLVL